MFSGLEGTISLLPSSECSLQFAVCVSKSLVRKSNVKGAFDVEEIMMFAHNSSIFIIIQTRKGITIYLPRCCLRFFILVRHFDISGPRGSVTGFFEAGEANLTCQVLVHFTSVSISTTEENSDQMRKKVQVTGRMGGHVRFFHPNWSLSLCKIRRTCLSLVPVLKP